MIDRFVDYVLNMDVYLAELVEKLGVWVYAAHRRGDLRRDRPRRDAVAARRVAAPDERHAGRHGHPQHPRPRAVALRGGLSRRRLQLPHRALRRPPPAEQAAALPQARARRPGARVLRAPRRAGHRAGALPARGAHPGAVHRRRRRHGASTVSCSSPPSPRRSG